MTIYTHRDQTGDETEVYRGLGNVVVANTHGSNRHRVAVCFSRDEAVSLALAVLEEAGADAAAAGLRALIAEAEDEAKLDAEAQEYRKVWHGEDAPGPWENLGTVSREAWRNIARKARELHAGAEA